MAISHVCLECGFDLAKVRAQRDPEYDLWIVRCPRCANCCARNPKLIGRAWHRILRVDMALSILLVQGLLLILFVSVNVAALNAATKLVDEATAGLWGDNHTAVLIIVLVTAVCTGAWLTAAFGHVARWRMWAGWSAILVVFVLVSGPNDRLGMELSARYGGEPFVDWIMRCAVVLSIIALLVAAYMFAAIPGVVPGRVLRAGHSAFRRLRWRMRRRRRRRWMVRV